MTALLVETPEVGPVFRCGIQVVPRGVEVTGPLHTLSLRGTRDEIKEKVCLLIDRTFNAAQDDVGADSVDMVIV